MRGGGSAADSGAARAACRLRASLPGAARLLGAGRQVEREQQVLRRRRGGEREAEAGELPAPRLKTSLTSGKALAEHAAPSEGRLEAAGLAWHPAPLPACGCRPRLLPPPLPRVGRDRCRAVRRGAERAAASPSKCLSRLRALLLLAAVFSFFQVIILPFCYLFSPTSLLLFLLSLFVN